MKKLLISLLVSSVLISPVFTASAEAAAKAISFAKGKTGAKVSGKVKGSDGSDFTISAKAGQTLIVDFKAGKGAAYFNVVAPNSTTEALFVGSRDGDHFEGVLPGDGVYTLKVYLMGGAKDSNKPVSFTLNVNIPASSTSAAPAPIIESGTAAAQKACLAAVAEKTGVSKDKLKVSDAIASEAAITVTITVPDATALWSCHSDKSGKVEDVMFTGSEGAL